MNIEEHINNLKKYIEEDFAFREPIKNMSDFDRYCWNHCKDIETILIAYEKEKENNKELRKYYATRKEVEELREINECLHDSAENYIHKNKVIEKVKEIKDRPVKDEFITATQGKLDTIIDIESLLNEEE